MSDRYVNLRISSTGTDGAKEKLDVLREKADELSRKRSIPISVDDEEGQERLADLRGHLDEIADRIRTARVKVDVDDHDANLKLDDLELRLERLDHRSYSARLNLRGADSIARDAERLGLTLDRLKLDGEGAGLGIGDLFKRTTSFKGIGQLLKAVRPGGEGLSSLAGQEVPEAGGLLTNPYTWGGIAALTSLLPGLLGLGTGALVGGGGLGIAALTNKGFRSKLGTLGGSLENIGAFVTQPIATAFNKLVPSIMGSITQMEPEMTKMFSASIPFIKAFVSLLLMAAKTVMPAFTQTMKEMVSSGALNTMISGLASLIRLLPALLKEFGPEMKMSADIFNGAMKVISGILLGIGILIHVQIDVWRTFGAFIETIVKVIAGLVTGNFGAAGRAIEGFGKTVEDMWDSFRHATAAAIDEAFPELATFGHNAAHVFDDMRHDISSVWDDMWHYLIHDVASGVDNINHMVDDFRHNIASGFDALRHSVASVWDDMWNDVKRMTSDGVHSVAEAVHGIENAFRTPVAFVVNDVWDRMAGIWNHIAGIAHISSLKLPVVHMSTGGKVPGHGRGDIVPAMLEPGERVLSRSQVAAMGGHGALDALVGRGTGGPFGFSGGGIIGDIGHWLSGLGKELLGWITKPVSFIMDHMFSPIVGLMSHIPGSASGMDAVLKSLTTSLMRSLVNIFKTQGMSGFGGKAGPATPGLITVAKYIMAHGGSRAAGAGVAGTVAGESMGNPEAIEAGGGGGTGLLQWTPGSSAFPIQPLITGNVRRDMGVQLVDMMAYIASRGGLGRINAAGVAGGPMGAASVFSAMEAPAVPGSDIRSSIVMQLYKEGYANGGWINEPIFGTGLRTGRIYTLGERGPEYVTPAGHMRGSMGGGDIINVNIEANFDTDQTINKIITGIRRVKRHRGMRKPTPAGELGIA